MPFFSFKTMFEGIAKTNTTHTHDLGTLNHGSLRVLLKQIQHTPLTCQKHHQDV